MSDEQNALKDKTRYILDLSETQWRDDFFQLRRLADSMNGVVGRDVTVAVANIPDRQGIEHTVGIGIVLLPQPRPTPTQQDVLAPIILNASKAPILKIAEPS